MASIPPVVHHIEVSAPPLRAFDLFVDAIGQWWPLDRLSVFGADATVAFEGRSIVEVAPSGERSVWGTVLDAVEGERMLFTWHPGRDDGPLTAVDVRFSTAPGRDDRTRVELVHSGWERLEDPSATRAEYERGWPGVLADYAARVAGE